jgi:hypothetical protein
LRSGAFFSLLTSGKIAVKTFVASRNHLAQNIKIHRRLNADLFYASDRDQTFQIF